MRTAGGDEGSGTAGAATAGGLRDRRIPRATQWLTLVGVTAAILYLTVGLTPFGGSGRSAGFSFRPFRNLEFIARQLGAGNLFSSAVAYEVLAIIGNIALFWIWSFLALHAFSPRGGMATSEALLLAIAIGAGLSVGIELLQLTLPERAADIDDVLENVFGTAMGALHASFRRRNAIVWD